jgi:hypothetical protein
LRDSSVVASKDAPEIGQSIGTAMFGIDKK